MKNEELNTFITKFYTYKLFSIMGFILPFVAVMFDKNGLSATQIALCMMAAKAIQFITEIPSGVIADKYSRRNVLIASQLFVVIAYTFWLFMPYFCGYLLGYICFGLGISLDSGCNEAFLFDKLKQYEKRSLYERVRGRSNALVSAGIMIGSLVASYLFKQGFDFGILIIGTIATTLVSIVILSSIKSAKNFKDSGEVKHILSYIQILKKGISYSYKHTTIAKLLLFAAFSSFANIGFAEYGEIFYNELTNNLAIVALIYSANKAMTIIGNLIGEFFKKVSIRFLVLIYLVVGCLDTVAFVLYKFPISIFIILSSTVIIYAAIVNVSAKINDLIPSKIRATVLSVKGFIHSLGAFIFLFSFGIVVDSYGSYRIGFITFSVVSAIVTFVFLVILWKDQHLRKREKRLR